MSSQVFQMFIRQQKERELTEKALLGSALDMVWTYNINRQGDAQRQFVFVEGKTDEQFYRMSLEKFRTALFLSSELNEENEERGKKSVVKSLIQISGRKEFVKDFHRCLFIVDRDYDPEVKMTGFDLKDINKQKLRITKGHSLENYLLYDHNWDVFEKRLLEVINLSEISLQDLKRELGAFLKKYAKYFAASATITEAVTTSSGLEYKKSKHTDSIFIYVFPDHIVDNYAYGVEIKRMERFIDDNNLDASFNYYKKEIKRNPFLFVRGHNVYEYIRAYIKYHWKYDIGDFANPESFKSILPFFHVDFNEL